MNRQKEEVVQLKMSGERVNQVIIEKLDKHNFLILKYGMTTTLIGKVYWEYREGDSENQPELDELHPMADQCKALKE